MNTGKRTGRQARAQTEATNAHREKIAMGHTLRRLRREAGLTQKQVAASLGVSYQQVQKYEKGISSLAATAVPILARLYNRPCAAFFEEDPVAAKTGEDMMITRLYRQVASLQDRHMRRKIARVVTILAS